MGGSGSEDDGQERPSLGSASPGGEAADTPPSIAAGALPSPKAFLGLIGLGALIGIPAALVAALFLAVVHWAVDLLWTDLPDALGYDEPPWFMLLTLPMVGALVVWVARRFLPGDGGHDPIAGLATKPTPWQFGPSVALAAFGTLAFGAVLGPEAPLIALGSVVGMAVTRFVRLGERGQTVIATAGSFSAVSALFGGPLVAGLLMLEAGISLGAALIPALVPGLVAAAVGYVLFIGLGSWGGINEAGLLVPELPAYDGTSVVDLLLAVVVGVLAAILMSQVRRIALLVHQATSKPGRMLVALLAGGLLVGLIAEGANLLGADSQAVLFSGQSGIPDVIDEGVGILLLLMVAKGLGYAICLGCGFRGGPVFPAIFLGVTIASFCVALFDASVTWAVAVGAAAGMTAGTGLLFSSLAISLLLVGLDGADALPAAVLGGVAAWVTRMALIRRSEPNEGA